MVWWADGALTYKVAREVSKTIRGCQGEHDGRVHAHTHIVKQMLMRRSQLQPVIIATAAGGKRMAIYQARLFVSPPLATRQSSS